MIFHQNLEGVEYVHGHDNVILQYSGNLLSFPHLATHLPALTNDYVLLLLKNKGKPKACT